MKFLSLALLCVPAFAQLGGENADCFIGKPILQFPTTPSFINTIRTNAIDSNNTATQYNVDYSLDDPTFSVAANVITHITSGGTWAYQLSPGPWGTGSANIFDGAQHLIYGRMHTNSNGIINCGTGFPIPFKYDSGTSAGTYTYPNLTSTFTSGVNSSTLAVIVSAGDTYSTGTNTGGAHLICTVGVGATPVYDNGVVGYYVNKYSIPCGNLSVASSIAGNNYLTITQANAMYAALDPPIFSGVQGIALGWVIPSVITPIASVSPGGNKNPTNQSISSFFAFKGRISQRYIIFASGALNGGSYQTGSNPYFQSLSSTPCTSLGICPTMMLAYATCVFSNLACTSGTSGVGTGVWTADFPSAQTAIDASFAAKNTNPTGGTIYHLNNTGDFTRSSSFTVSPLLAVGTNTGICPNTLNCVVSDNLNWIPPFNNTNILGVYVPATNPIPNPSTASYVASGVGFSSNMTSGGGDFAPTATGTMAQTPCMWHLNKGAAFCNGSVDEPVAPIFNYYSELNLMISYYTHGATAVEAMWASSRQPMGVNFAGDPLNQPFGSSPPPVGTGTYIIMLGALVAFKAMIKIIS